MSVAAPVEVEAGGVQAGIVPVVSQVSMEGRSEGSPEVSGDTATDAPLVSFGSVYADGDMTRGGVSVGEAESMADARENGGGKRGKKSAKNSREERLTAEQAAWVRRKFALPEREELVASFSAALVKHIMLQGRIHITSERICFYAKIFGRVTKEAWPFTDIKRVKKRRGGLVANAIKIYFEDDSTSPVVIGSLNHRERAFGVIQARLQERNPAAAEQGDVGDDNVSIASGQGLESDRSVEVALDGDASAGAARRGKTAAEIFPSRSIPDIDSDTTSEFSSRKSSDVDAMTRAESEPPAHSAQASAASAVAVAAEDKSQLVWCTPEDVMGRVAAKAYDNRTERARGVLNLPVKEVFNTLFLRDWLRFYHAESGNFDLAFSEWYREPDGFMRRDVSFRRPLGYKIGPKETRVKETQRYSFTRDGGVIVELQGQNLDAPYGDYFVVESFFEMRPHGDGSQTLMVASVAVHFNKSTILRSKIQSGALTETRTAFQRLLELAKKTVREALTQRHTAANARRQVSGQTVANDLRLDNAARAPSQGPPAAAASDGAVEAPSAHMGARSSSAPEAFATGGAGAPEGPVVDGLKATVEVGEAPSTRWLRMLGLGGLGAVCLLLLAVLVLLGRMHGSVRALEKLVGEERAAAGRCVMGGDGRCAMPAPAGGRA